VGELHLAVGVEDGGRREALDAGNRIGLPEVARLEEDVEVDVLDDRSRRQEAAAAAVEVLGVCPVRSSRQPILRDLVPGLELRTEAEPGVLRELDLTGRAQHRDARDGCSERRAWCRLRRLRLLRLLTGGRRARLRRLAPRLGCP